MNYLDDYKKRKSMKDFDISIDEIPINIRILVSGLSDKKKGSVQDYFSSASDYVFIFYYFRFVKKMSATQIAVKLKMEKPNVYNHLYDFGWDYSTDYDENEKRRIQHENQIKSKLTISNVKYSELDINKHPILEKALRDTDFKANRNMLKQTNTKTSSEYIKVLYYLRFVLKTPTKDLSKIMNITLTATIFRLNRLGFNLSHEEGIKLKVENKSQDYGQTHREGKRTRTLQQIEKGGTGSINEYKAREYLMSEIYNYFSPKQYEIIVGVNNTGILDSLEIDIPIVIFDLFNQKTYIFCVEYNSYSHTPERDNVKKDQATQKGWHYISIEEPTDGSYNSYPSLIKYHIKKICEEVREYIN